MSDKPELTESQRANNISNEVFDIIEDTNWFSISSLFLRTVIGFFLMKRRQDIKAEGRKEAKKEFKLKAPKEG